MEREIYYTLREDARSGKFNTMFVMSVSLLM